MKGFIERKPEKFRPRFSAATDSRAITIGAVYFHGSGIQYAGVASSVREAKERVIDCFPDVFSFEDDLIVVWCNDRWRVSENG